MGWTRSRDSLVFPRECAPSCSNQSRDAHARLVSRRTSPRLFALLRRDRTTSVDSAPPVGFALVCTYGRSWCVLRQALFRVLGAVASEWKGAPGKVVHLETKIAFVGQSRQFYVPEGPLQWHISRFCLPWPTHVLVRAPVCGRAAPAAPPPQCFRHSIASCRPCRIDQRPA